MHVVWNGSREHAGGRQLIVDEFQTRQAPADLPETPTPKRGKYDPRPAAGSRRRMCRCAKCSRRVDAAGERLCRVCKALG